MQWLNKGKTPYRISRGWVTPFKVLAVTGFKKARTFFSEAPHQKYCGTRLIIELWITEKLNWLCWFINSQLSVLKIITSIVVFARLRVVPHFSAGIVKRAKRERAWKSPHARKGDTRRGERKMRDYRQSPSFWPFTADWFWSVKFVSPSKSIKRIQWDSFPHWAVIALVIGKLRGIFIASKRKPRY